MTVCCRQKDAVVPAAVSTQFLLRSQVPTIIGDNKVDSCEPVNKLFFAGFDNKRQPGLCGDNFARVCFVIAVKLIILFILKKSPARKRFREVVLNLHEASNSNQEPPLFLGQRTVAAVFICSWWNQCRFDVVLDAKFTD